MEHFGILEKKLLTLIESKKSDMQRVAELASELEFCKQECAQLREHVTKAQDGLLTEVEILKDQNQQLRAQTEKLEEALLLRHQSIEGLTQERELAKMAVDDLIKSIDVLIEPEH